MQAQPLPHQTLQEGQDAVPHNVLWCNEHKHVGLLVHILSCDRAKRDLVCKGWSSSRAARPEELHLAVLQRIGRYEGPGATMLACDESAIRQPPRAAQPALPARLTGAGAPVHLAQDAAHAIQGEWGALLEWGPQRTTRSGLVFATFVMLRPAPCMHARVGCTNRPASYIPKQGTTTTHRKHALAQRLLHAHAHALALSRQRRRHLAHRLQLHLRGLLRRSVC